MRLLRTNTAVVITVGPFFDKTDGVTPKTSLTATNEHITLAADTDAGSVPTLILDITGAGSATSNDFVHITGDDAGFYSLELAAADVNRLGRVILAITDAANHCPVFHEFMILPAVIYDAMVLGTDLFDVSMTQILGTAVSTPATAGILDINLKNIANAAVSASTAQLGVNVVNAAGTAWASGAITAASIAANAITAAKVATDAIGAAQLGADAVTEIQAGLATPQDFWDALTSALTTSGSIGKLIVDNLNATITSRASQTSVDGLDSIPKNAQLANFEFLMVDSSDHVTPKTGLTITSQRSIDGAAFGACANSAAEVSAGIYKITLAAADLNGDVITLKFTATGADARYVTIKTQS